MLLDVKQIFEDHLKTTLITQPEVLKFVLNHERKDLCIRNLCDQILVSERKLRAKFDQKKYKLMIESIANQFAQAAIDLKKQEILSQSEKKRLIKQADSLKEAEECVNDLEDFSRDKIKVFQTR